MARDKTTYRCSECGTESPKWAGQCSRCKAWNSLDEQSPTQSARARPKRVPRPQPITEIPLNAGEVRLRVGMPELDRVLGGGLVTGSLTLLGGDPGVGKSTLLLMVLESFSRRGLKTLYVSGEESATQVRLRAERLGVHSPGLHLLAETDLDGVLAAAEELKPTALVLDSVQTLAGGRLDSVPGSVSQVREVAARAMELAKRVDLATFLVGHVTKQGGIAGPKVLEHLVDTVLYFEGDGRSQLRAVRATKNRFGATGELGFFEMVNEGLREVPDASARLLAERVAEASGTAVTAAMEGSRPVLAEFGKCGHSLHDRDVFASAAGGIRIQEPGVDLALAAALVGSLRDRHLDPHTLVFGEIGLVGEVRAVGHPGPRIAEARRHGFKRVIGPAVAARDAPEGIQVVGVRSLTEALRVLFP
jgi:DNA repair protein RadA/Sms